MKRLRSGVFPWWDEAVGYATMRARVSGVRYRVRSDLGLWRAEPAE